MGKRATLSDFAAKKPPAEEPSPVAPAPGPAAAAPAQPKPERRAQTLRLTPAAWRQLKQLALDHGRPAHDLLLEAVNDLFRKNGRPPIA